MVANRSFIAGRIRRQLPEELMPADYDKDNNLIVHMGEVDDNGNLVCSDGKGIYAGLHLPTLDIDFPCTLIPSSTIGHHHLYIEKPLTWDKYKELLEVLAKCGIIEEGYYAASLKRGYTSLRHPDFPKQNNDDEF